MRGFGLVFAAPVASLLLTACAGAVPGSPQGHAGIARAKVEFCESANGNHDRYVCAAEVVDGKERESVRLKVDLPLKGTVEYEAAGVRAFDGQEARAAVEQAVSDDVRQAFPGLVDAVVKALTVKFGG